MMSAIMNKPKHMNGPTFLLPRVSGGILKHRDNEPRAYTRHA